MDRKVSTLISLGISIAIIAGGIWFLSNHHSIFPYGGGQWHMPHQMWSGGTGMIGIMIVFWILVIAAVVFMASGLAAAYFGLGRHGKEKDFDALEILRKRYASGEIDKTQFEAMRRDLSSVSKRE